MNYIMRLYKCPVGRSLKPIDPKSNKKYISIVI